MIIKLIILLCISGFVFVCLFVGGNNDMRIIAGCEYEYEYYSRKLSINDFRQFGYDTMYLEVVDAIGKENGDIGNNYFYPYYELSDGTYAIIAFRSMQDGIKRIDIADKNEILYSLLPYIIPHKEDEEKAEELSFAKQYEMNIILELLGIKKWEKPQTFGKTDDPLGIYSKKELKEYTNETWLIEIKYWFDDYENSNWEPLYQSVRVYQNNKLCGLAIITWNDCLLLEYKSI